MAPILNHYAVVAVSFLILAKATQRIQQPNPYTLRDLERTFILPTKLGPELRIFYA